MMLRFNVADQSCTTTATFMYRQGKIILHVPHIFLVIMHNKKKLCYISLNVIKLVVKKWILKVKFSLVLLFFVVVVISYCNRSWSWFYLYAKSQKRMNIVIICK